jgi:nitroreductase
MNTNEPVKPANETLKTIASRHSTRMFLEKDVPEECIKTILKAANDAPSAHNQQSWKFIVLKGAKKQGLANLITEKSASFPRPSSTLLRMAARSVIAAPVVIAISNTGDLINHGMELFNVEKKLGYDFFRTMEIQSSAAAVQNLLLAATSTGLGSVWLGVLYLIKDEMLQFLGDPKGEFMAIVPVGYPLKPASGPKKKPIEATVRYCE